MSLTLAIALLIFVILTLVALLHLFWAVGGKWPGKDDESLAKAVIGRKGMTKIPKAGLTFLVALLIFIAGIIPLLWLVGKDRPLELTQMAPVSFHPILALMNSMLPLWVLKTAMIGLTLIFFARGLVTYTSLAQQQTPEEPFRSLDKKYYAPLCLGLGVCYLCVLLSKL
ncbi:MAG: DUF3995 domain-containing protein [Rhizobiales bacterium]|nr:DUF3995 domain-containing protein [Hyphomicrobiales bacterium]